MSRCGHLKLRHVATFQYLNRPFKLKGSGAEEDALWKTAALFMGACEEARDTECGNLLRLLKKTSFSKLYAGNIGLKSWISIKSSLYRHYLGDGRG